MRPIVGGNTDGKKLASLGHAFSHEPVMELKILMGCAGAPTTMVLDGTTPRTTEFAPTIAPVPMVAGPMITELSPIHTFSPMTTGPPPPNKRCAGASSGLLWGCPLYTPCLWSEIYILLPKREL